jgi:hypothetical protein
MNESDRDYALTIIREDGGYVVCEGGKSISLPFEDRAEAERWADQHAKWNQPFCCVCQGKDDRPDDPWEVYSVSSSTGADWMHRSCLQKFQSWADGPDRPRGPGPHRIPPMAVLDGAWQKKHESDEC